MNTLRRLLCKHDRSPAVIYRQCMERPFDTTKPKKIRTAVLMVYTGGPKCAEEVPCFLKRILLDKHLSYGPYNREQRIKEAEAVIPKFQIKYAAIGDRTPQFHWMRRQAKLMQERLDLMCTNTAPHKTFIGCQFVKPSIADALIQINEVKTLKNILVLPMYPQYSCGLTGGCMHAIYKFYKAHPLPEGVKWAVVESWATTYSLIKNTAYFIRKELVSCDLKKEPYTLIFAGHPMPLQATRYGDFYAYLVGATALHIVKQLDSSLPYAIAWHDPPGTSQWFQPTVRTVIKDYVRKGRKWFMLVPISTVVENMVTFYDYDICLKKKILPELGSDLKLTRISAANDSGYFINAVVDVCKETLMACDKIPQHTLEHCLLCGNPECKKYKLWYKNLLGKQLIGASPKKKKK